MKLKVFDAFVAEGEEAELATYTIMLLDLLKHMKEREDKLDAAREVSAFEKFLNMSFAEMMNLEQDKQDGDDE